MPSNVQAMVNDPEFLGMPPAQQREALYKLTGDDSFNSLKNGELMQFTSRLRATPAVLNRPQLPTPAQVTAPLAQGMQPFGASGPAAGKLTGLPGVNPHSPTAGEVVGDVALAASPALAGPVNAGRAAVGRLLAQQMVKHPIAGPALASYAISKAREIPYVGDILKKIPQAELIPWIIGVKPGEPTPAAAEKPPVYPGARFPETPAPEQLNPSLASESRTLPGQVGKETVWTKPTPAQPIPQRQGLALPAPAGQELKAMETELAQQRPLGTPAAEKGGSPYAVRTAPEMTPVDSTNVRKIGYNPDTGHVWTEFRNGAVYRSSGVPKEVFQRYQDSESQGSFYARNIKGRYSTQYMGNVGKGK